MQTVEQIAAAIVAREGGFVNDPDDPGGATNHGVTLGTMKQLGIDLNHDGRVDVADVKALSPAKASDIFVTHYFTRPGLGKLPEALQAQVFDMAVNAGTNSIKILQRLVSEMGYPCAADGVLGPQTLGCVDGAWKVAAAFLSDAYAIARRNYYYALADARPASRKYARRRDGGKGGWILRAEEYMQPKYRLTDAQHRARVAKWA